MRRSGIPENIPGSIFRQILKTIHCIRTFGRKSYTFLSTMIFWVFHQKFLLRLRQKFILWLLQDFFKAFIFLRNFFWIFFIDTSWNFFEESFRSSFWYFSIKMCMEIKSQIPQLLELLTNVFAQMLIQRYFHPNTFLNPFRSFFFSKILLEFYYHCFFHAIFLKILQNSSNNPFKKSSLNSCQKCAPRILLLKLIHEFFQKIFHGIFQKLLWKEEFVKESSAGDSVFRESF